MTLQEFKVFTQSNSNPHHIKAGAAFEWTGKGKIFTRRFNWGLALTLAACGLFWAAFALGFSFVLEMLK